MHYVNFTSNSAGVGGAICFMLHSKLFAQNVYFSQNKANQQVPFKDSDSVKNMPEDGYGGAIYFANASVAEMHHVNFTCNTAYFGGAICFMFHSKMYAQNVYFGQSASNIGNASCAGGAAMELSVDCTINMSGLTCENHSSNLTSCISAVDNCSVRVDNSTFRMNEGDVLTLSNSHIYVVNSSFFSNSSPMKRGGVIFADNSTLHISHSFFYHNKATFGGAFRLELSSAVVNNCTFLDNSNSAVMLSSTNISIKDCTFENNSSPLFGAALYVSSFSEANVSNTKLLKNSASTGGAVSVEDHSLLMIFHSYFSENSATPGAGTPQIEKSELQSLISVNVNSIFYAGGSIYSDESSLLIFDTVFESNIAGSYGGAISSSGNSSIVIKDSQFKNNSVQDKAMGNGGGLLIRNSTAELSNVYFFENKAPEGAAIYAWEFCHITMCNNTIEDNTGSAIAFYNNVHSKINNSRFSNNLASYKGGGAILSKAGCILHVTKTVFKGNKAIGSGGAFSGLETTTFFHNCSFTNNFAFKGGALAASTSQIELFTSNFTNNSATEGGVFATGGNLLLDHCIMSNNTAHENGGVGYIEENYQMNIMKSVFWFNSATHAGGVFWLRKAIANITDSFFAINWAGISGGVIHAEYF